MLWYLLMKTIWVGEHKWKVFLSNNDDHIRNRMTHTLEVSQIVRTISEALRLNITLTEAIALAHDLRHTPYGGFYIIVV